MAAAEEAEAPRAEARGAGSGTSGAMGAERDGRRSMMAGGREAAEASENGDKGWVAGEKRGGPLESEADGAAVDMGDAVGRGEEAAVVIGRSMAARSGGGERRLLG